MGRRAGDTPLLRVRLLKGLLYLWPLLLRGVESGVDGRDVIIDGDLRGVVGALGVGVVNDLTPPPPLFGVPFVGLGLLPYNASFAFIS